MAKEDVADLFPISKEIKLLVEMIAGTILIGTIGYALILRITPLEGFIRTLETLTFAASYEYIGIAKALHLIILLFGVVIIWFALWTSFDLMIEGQFTKYFTGVRLMERIKKMKDHYIICGGGRVGEHIAELLVKQKKRFILIEKHSDLSENLMKKDFAILKGDALEESTLLKANIKQAQAVISVLPETEKNILVTLTAKELNPEIKIYSRADKKEYVKKLHKAGADFVSMPEYTCAEEIVGKLQ
ncbi:MAG TPA: NAD(P)-binding protein [Candidatus Nanoarchaeia archaeon]|nr:NAD(P)-binding protein [Candidatus Nanoarchaeia archaeon]